MSRAATLPPMLLGLVVLLLAQMVGLAVAALLDLPVPGVVLGLVLLLVLGLLRPTRAVLRIAEPAATPLLQHLQLLFVPPGVGIVLEMHALAQNALPLALAVGGSFVLTLLIAGWLLQALLARQDRRRGGTADDPYDGSGTGPGRGPGPGPAGPGPATGRGPAAPGPGPAASPGEVAP
jgi:holin-like protein